MHFLRVGVSGLLLSAAVAMTAEAQGGRQVDFGVLAGGTFSKFGGADKDIFGAGSSKTRVGFAAGGFVAVSLAPAFAIEPEVLFVQKGQKGELTGGTAQVKLSYLEVPLLLKVRMPAKGNGSQFSPHAYAGPAIGFKTSCTIATHPTGGSATSQSCEDAGTDAKSTDISLVLGAGVDIGRAIITARYDLGLKTIDSSSSPDDVKNRTFYLLAGWTFRTPR